MQQLPAEQSTGAMKQLYPHTANWFMKHICMAVFPAHLCQFTDFSSSMSNTQQKHQNGIMHQSKQQINAFLWSFMLQKGKLVFHLLQGFWTLMAELMCENYVCASALKHLLVIACNKDASFEHTE